jgi:hypothetical protein
MDVGVVSTIAINSFNSHSFVEYTIRISHVCVCLFVALLPFFDSTGATAHEWHQPQN